MLKLLTFSATLLLSAPAAALTLTGTFLPTTSNNALNIGFGALDTGGMFGNATEIQAGRHRFSFTLSRPADTYLSLQLVYVYNDYDREGRYVGGDEHSQYVFDRYAFTDSGVGYMSVPNAYRTPGFDGGRTEYYFFGRADLEATFSELDVPVNYTINIERIGDVPEPATWAMMIGGFAMTGFAMRKRALAPVIGLKQIV